MTIASTTTKQIMNGDGVTRSWPFTFRAWEDEVQVIVADAADIETDVTAASIVTLDPGGDGGTVDYPAASLSPALPAGHRIVIMRSMDLVQETRLVNVTRFDPAVIENQLDRLIANDQQQQEQIDRALSVGVASDHDPGAVIEEVFQARDRAEMAATEAAGSAAVTLPAATAAADSAAEAMAWAEEARDIVVSNGPVASPVQKGIVPAGGASGQVYRVSAAGTAYGWENFPEVRFATAAETVAGTATNKATTPAGVKAVTDPISVALATKLDASAVPPSGIAPNPQSTSGVGQWYTASFTGNPITLPPGGTWAWIVWGDASSPYTGLISTHRVYSGISAGGTPLYLTFGSTAALFAWRIS